MVKKAPQQLKNASLQLIDEANDQIFANLEKKIVEIGLFEKESSANQFLTELKDKKMQIKEKIRDLDGKKKKNTDLGRSIIKDRMNEILKIKNHVSFSDDVTTALHDIDDFQDSLEESAKKISSISYHYLILTLVGFFASILPYFNLLSFGIGGYLLYSRDLRGKVFGILIIANAIFNLLFAQLLLLWLALILL
ncbi:MAG: hypothetical protein ACTSRW_05515 [Candidatus Helarchaeota archaeon]